MTYPLIHKEQVKNCPIQKEEIKPSVGRSEHAGIVTSSLAHDDTPLFVNPSKMAHYSCGRDDCQAIRLKKKD
jgi:hypothetical protein